jgi:PAS domain S-box-containing protein
VLAETYTRALDQNADSVVITNRDGVIQYVNPAFENMTGFAREEALGRTPRLVRSGVATPQFYETLWNTILSGRAFRTTITNRRQDGRLFEQEQTITPIRDASGRITHFVSTGRDITHRQQSAVARVQRLLELEGVRTAGLLHDEAGQFLALAHMTLAGLAHGMEPDKAARLQEVRQHLHHVEARLQQGARGIRPRILAELGLVEAIRFLAEEAERRTGALIRFESSLDRQFSPSTEFLMYRFVEEALLNVERHASATCASILLAWHVGGRRATDTLLSCAVVDDGCGFDIARLTNETSRVQGLGLLQDTLQAAGGTLTVISGPGDGTDLRASIPVEAG